MADHPEPTTEDERVESTAPAPDPATADTATAEAEAQEVAPLPEAPAGMSERGLALLEGVRQWHDGESTDEELVEFLATFDYATQGAPRPSRPKAGDADDLGRWYNEVETYVPAADGTWAQVDSLANTGAIDRELYYQARERLYGV